MQHGMNILASWASYLIWLYLTKVQCSDNISCVVTSGTATLTLPASKTLIGGTLLDRCPTNIHTLKIVGNESNEYGVSSDFFHLSQHPYLENVHFHVPALRIVPSDFMPISASPIKSLSLSNCGIASIPFGFSRSLRSLERIDISDNSIIEVPPDFLMYSPRVNLVNLSRNRLKFLPNFHLDDRHAKQVYIDVSRNHISCHCANAWLMNHSNFTGIPSCISSIPPCDPSLVTHLKANYSEYLEDAKVASILATQSISFTCQVISPLPVKIFWISPLGIVPPRPGASEFEFVYYLQPFINPTSVRTFTTNSSSTIHVTNIRGHLSGEWYCVARSDVDIVISKPLNIVVTTSIYHAQVYYLSLCYGYGGMVILLLIGIVGGTIRYCSETRCMRRPQPPFAYGGKAFIGVIPVPEIEENFTEKLGDSNVGYDIAETSVRYISAQPLCSACSRPPTYWFCSKCKSVHFVDSVFHSLESDEADSQLSTGILTSEGEIKINDPIPFLETNIPSDMNRLHQNQSDPHEPLMKNQCGTSGLPMRSPKSASPAISNDQQCIFVRSGNCVVKVIRGGDNDPGYETEQGFSSNAILSAICMHSKPRTKSVDVKLVVSNERLAEEYRTALEDLALAVENPDPARFREYLEDFRSRLRRDVGHGVKVLRGEFRGLRAKSVRGVANLRNQGTAAAQKVRAGLSYGVEQVRGSMRSVAELCGGSVTIGQTISVVSVYIDETDQVKKERVISDFIF